MEDHVLTITRAGTYCVLACFWIENMPNGLAGVCSLMFRLRLKIDGVVRYITGLAKNAGGWSGNEQ